MTRFLFIVLAVLFVAACKPGIPKDIIQPEIMEKVLFDIHVLDGYVSEIPTPDSAKKVTSTIYKGIFKKYGVDSAVHSKSMSYYYAHPDLLTKMYNNISNRLEKTKDIEVTKQEKIERLKLAKTAAKLKKEVAAKKLDSIRKSNKSKQADTAKKPVTKVKIVEKKLKASIV